MREFCGMEQKKDTGIDHVGIVAVQSPEYGPQINGVGEIEARKNGYKWEKIIDRIEYDSAARLYGVDSIRKLDIPWGEIFARTIHDWDKDSPRVISLIKDDENNLRSFYTSSNKPYRQKNNVLRGEV